MINLLNIKTGLKHKRARNCLALLALIFIQSIPSELLSQSEFNYFEKRIDHHNNYDYSRNIIEYDSTYIIAGFTEDSVYLYNIHLSFTKISKDGNELDFKEYGFDTINMFLGNPGSLIKFSDTTFLSVGTKRIYTSDWVHDEGMITCINNNLDTLWIKYFGEQLSPYDTSFMLYQIKHNNSSLIQTGLRMPNGVASKIWLLKTDSLGNKLWEKFYGEGNEYFQGHSVVQTADGGYVIGAVKFIIQASGGSVDPLILKTDSLGNEEWRLNPGNPNVDDNKVMVALAQDGNIIAGTNYGTEQSGDHYWARVKIMKISPYGMVLWNKNYLQPQYDNYLLNTIVLNNGNIVINGSRNTYALGNEYPEKKGWILCTDSLGNQLWYKEYALLTGHNSYNDLYDVRETFDGGLIGVGKVSPVVPDTGTSDIWVMKMDSMGCLWAGCDTTVGINSTTSGYTSFVLYPVPATNRLTVKLPEEAEKGTLFTVYNILGTKVKSVTIPQQAQTATLNVGSLPQGVYLGVLTVKDNVTGKRKFIIQK